MLKLFGKHHCARQGLNIESLSTSAHLIHSLCQQRLEINNAKDINGFTVKLIWKYYKRNIASQNTKN